MEIRNIAARNGSTLITDTLGVCTMLAEQIKRYYSGDDPILYAIQIEDVYSLIVELPVRNTKRQDEIAHFADGFRAAMRVYR